jgi:AbrB family looped-hinge helix DNA binding protein
MQWYLDGMSDTITMDNVGRIVLPKALRERFRLKGGAKLRLETVGDHLELRPLEDEVPPQLVKKRGLLVVRATGEPCDAQEAIRDDRADRDERIEVISSGN